jgi:hypothetical protein
MQFERFESWADVVSYAKQHGHLWYQAPLDVKPTKLEATLPKRKPRGSMVPGDGWKECIRLTPHAALEADPFGVFSDHLARMRRPVYGPLRGLAAGTRVKCRYREQHQGTLLAFDDPRAWQGSIAFGDGLPDRDAVRDHVLKHLDTLGKLWPYHNQPVLWDFGKVYWDSDLTAVEVK